MSLPSRFSGDAAFPRPENSKGFQGSKGMSLRDWFAGQALAGIATTQEQTVEYAADLAYQIADAMIQVKARTEEELNEK